MSTHTSRIHVKFPGGKRVDALVRDQTIKTDQSVAHGGDGSAAEPFDLSLASLATCAGLYVLVFCQARNIPTNRLSLVQDQVFENGRLLGIRLSVVVPADFPDKYLDAVRAAASSCRVKRALSEPPDVEVVVVLESAPSSRLPSGHYLRARPAHLLTRKTPNSQAGQTSRPGQPPERPCSPRLHSQLL